MILAATMLIDLVQAERVSDYNLKLYFSDGAERVVDFGPFLNSSQNPMIRAHLDPEKFGEFRLEHGDWFGMILDCASRLLISTKAGCSFCILRASHERLPLSKSP